MIANDRVRLPAGPRIWSTDVAGGRMHVIVDGRAVVAPTRADLRKLEGEEEMASPTGINEIGTKK